MLQNIKKAPVNYDIYKAKCCKAAARASRAAGAEQTWDNSEGTRYAVRSTLGGDEESWERVYFLLCGTSIHTIPKARRNAVEPCNEHNGQNGQGLLGTSSRGGCTNLFFAFAFAMRPRR